MQDDGTGFDKSAFATFLTAQNQDNDYAAVIPKIVDACDSIITGEIRQCLVIS